MATIINPKFSFVKWGFPNNKPEYDFALPVCKNGSDLQFQFRLRETNYSKYYHILSTATASIYFIPHNATITDEASVISFALTSETRPIYIQKIVNSGEEILFYTNDEGDMGDIPEGCFRMAIVVEDSESTKIILVSNKFNYTTDDSNTALVFYKCNGNAFDFIYCADSLEPNRVRVPLILNKPQYATNSGVYTDSQGYRKTTYSHSTKSYECKTDYLPEWIHECLQAALVHDSLFISAPSYNGHVVLDGNYDIEWNEIEGLEVVEGQGVFKVLVTPFKMGNSNCNICAVEE